MLLQNAFIEIIDKIIYSHNLKININKRSDKFSRLVLCVAAPERANFRYYDSLILNAYNSKVIIASTF